MLTDPRKLWYGRIIERPKFLLRGTTRTCSVREEHEHGFIMVGHFFFKRRQNETHFFPSNSHGKKTSHDENLSSIQITRQMKKFINSIKQIIENAKEENFNFEIFFTRQRRRHDTTGHRPWLPKYALHHR